MRDAIKNLHETSDKIIHHLDRYMKDEVTAESVGQVAHAGIAVATLERTAFDIGRGKGI